MESSRTDLRNEAPWKRGFRKLRVVVTLAAVNYRSIANVSTAQKQPSTHGSERCLLMAVFKELKLWRFGSGDRTLTYRPSTRRLKFLETA